jgi:hypothetical protein
MRIRPYVAFLLACAAATPARAGVVLGDCGWLEFTSLPGVSVSTDTNTLIYQSVYSASPAHETVIRGRPPKARFWAFAVLDQARREIANLSDYEIQREPDGGYQVLVRFGCGGAKNCIDLSAAPAPVVPERIWYRMYVPDLDAKGGVPLPDVEYRPLGDSGSSTPLPLDRFVDCPSLVASATVPLRPGGIVHSALAAPPGTAAPVCEPGPDAEPARYEGTIERSSTRWRMRGRRPRRSHRSATSRARATSERRATTPTSRFLAGFATETW